MKMPAASTGLAGPGAMMRMHLYALDALRHYYTDAKRFVLHSVLNEGKRAADLARDCGARLVPAPEFWGSGLDAVIIASPNEMHFEHLSLAIKASIPRIYVEKPVCCGEREWHGLCELAAEAGSKKLSIQIGFQFLQSAAFQKGWSILHEGGIGDPVSFSGEYLHQSYLNSAWRKERTWRLRERPVGGAMVDLGSHVLSGLVSLLGPDLTAVHAAGSHLFEDIPAKCDMDSVAILRDGRSGAFGTLRASRVSAGSGDLLRFQVFGTQGSLCISTEHPDEVRCADASGNRSVIPTARGYPGSTFPPGHVPSGWLRSLVHAHARFWGISEDDGPLPDLDHALHVQRILNDLISQIQPP